MFNHEPSQLAGKHLLFRLAEESYALPILQVREIISLQKVTRVPRASACVLGVINLRGKVIPVMDLRLRFALERIEATEQTVIIVLQCQVADRQMTIGVVVDDVQEVILIREEDIAPPPPGASIQDDFISAIGTPKADQIIFLLDVDAVVNIADPNVLGASTGDVELSPGSY